MPHSYLIIDDNQDDIYLLEHALRSADPDPIECVTISSWGRAIEVLEQNLEQGRKPDLIILDWHIPERGGQKVLEWLTACHDYRDTPTIVFSSSSDQAEIEKAYKLGARCFISKPFRLAELMTIARQFRTRCAVSCDVSTCALRHCPET